MVNQGLQDKLGSIASKVPLDEKLAFLRSAANYPDHVEKVEVIETHMSWVFLTDRHAYKLKKPVHYDLLDFSTLEARSFYCDEEVRLNRRLARDVYIGKIPLAMDDGGKLCLDGEGAIADWLVKMHRLPVEKMLDHRIAAGLINEGDARRIANVLAGFYSSCPPVALETDDYARNIEDGLCRSTEVLCSDGYPLSAPAIREIHSLQIAALHSLAPVLESRVKTGKIIEGHGDLRPEHVCLQNRISIIDCLEFSQSLRVLDMADEFAFLALECERLGAISFATTLIEECRAQLKDDAPPALIHFYQSYRAIMRAKLAIRHLDEEQFRLSDKWIARTNHYLALAASHIRQTCAALEVSRQ